MSKIGLISLNTNDGNFKTTRVKTNHYTGNYIKRDNKKHVTGRTLKRVSEETASQLMKSGGKEAIDVRRKDFIRRKQKIELI